MHLGEALVLEERQLGVAEPGFHVRELAPGTEVLGVQAERSPELDASLVELARRQVGPCPARVHLRPPLPDLARVHRPAHGGRRQHPDGEKREHPR